MAGKAARSRYRAPAAPKRGVGWAVFLLLTVAVGIWGLHNHPTYRERRFAHASLQDLERARDGNPGDAVLLYHLGQRLNQQRRYGDAELVLEQAARIEPDTARLRDAWANAQMGQGKVAEAFTQLRQFVGTHPESAPGRQMLGKFYVAMHSLVRAREELEKAVALDPNSGEAWLYLARARDTAQYALIPAREAAEKAVTLLPEDVDGRLLLAALLSRESRPDDVRREYEKAVALAPDRADAHRRYADWLLNHGDRETDARTAEAEARAAIRLAGPDDADAQLLLGLALIRNGRPSEAVAALEAAAAGLPNDPVPARKLQRIYAAEGHKTEAAKWERQYLSRQSYKQRVETLRQAVSARPEDTSVRQRYAQLLCSHGETEQCLRQYAGAEHTTMDSPVALVAAANDLTAAGYAADALGLARRAAASAPDDPAARKAIRDALAGIHGNQENSR